MLLKALAVLRQAERAAAIALLAAVVTVVIIGTIFRFAGSPAIWTEEAAQASFVWLSLIAADMTLQRHGHFRLDVLVGLLPKKARLALDIVIHLVIGALLAFLMVYAWKFVAISNLRPLPIIGVPSSFATAALPVGFALMTVTLVEQIFVALSGRETKTEVRDVV
jgi:TRAP-type C4-dicarboxylate transport system permease small subunit